MLLVLLLYFSLFFFLFTLGHFSNLSYSLSWRTEHQKSPLWRSRTLCQRSCTTLWYKSLLSSLLIVYFLLFFYVTMWVIMAFIFFWSHCRKKSFIQTWSCVPSWLWLLSPSVPAQYSSPSKSVKARFCSCNTFLGRVQWGERNIFFTIFFPLLSSLYSPLLASSCISWPELSASLHIISSLSCESSYRGSAWLILCSGPESIASLRSEVSVRLLFNLFLTDMKYLWATCPYWTSEEKASKSICYFLSAFFSKKKKKAWWCISKVQQLKYFPVTIAETSEGTQND